MHGLIRSISVRVEIVEKTLSPEHPTVAANLNNLAALYSV